MRGGGIGWGKDWKRRDRKGEQKLDWNERRMGDRSEEDCPEIWKEYK
jgi:hypothetical protein